MEVMLMLERYKQKRTPDARGSIPLQRQYHLMNTAYIIRNTLNEGKKPWVWCR